MKKEYSEIYFKQTFFSGLAELHKKLYRTDNNIRRILQKIESLFNTKRRYYLYKVEMIRVSGKKQLVQEHLF